MGGRFITASVIREIRRRPDLAALCKRSDAEVRERGQQIPECLGHWRSEGREADIEQRYEMLGKARFEESIALHESVRALVIIKDKMIDFVHDQNWSAGWGASFDELAIHMVRGYETA
jgi:hypothetical protein